MQFYSKKTYFCSIMRKKGGINMPKNEFNNNNISNSTIYNNQTNIINGENKIPINNCIEQNSRNFGNYFIYLFINIIALIADISTIVSFFISSDKENIVTKYFDVFQNHKSMLYLIVAFVLLLTFFVVLIVLKSRKGYGKFVVIENKIHYIITKKCPQCNHNTARKLSVKQIGNHGFQFVCKNNSKHNINIDYGHIIDYIK